MVGSLQKLAAAALLSGALAGCASTSETPVADVDSRPSFGATIETPDKPNQCVPYARTRSGIVLYGDANTWWAKADGRYQKSSTPLLGSVMVLSGYASDGRAHLAVVSTLVSEGEIRVDHANWLNDGSIYVDDPVIDVSAAHDWSAVRVWNARARAWGTRVYQVEGFIGPGPAGEPDKIALN